MFRCAFINAFYHCSLHPFQIAVDHLNAGKGHTYTTIAALYAKICPKNSTDLYTHGLNYTPIIAEMCLRLHIASPQPLGRSLFAFVLCFLRKKKASPQLRFLDPIFMRSCPADVKLMFLSGVVCMRGIGGIISSSEKLSIKFMFYICLLTFKLNIHLSNA